MAEHVVVARMPSRLVVATPAWRSIRAGVPAVVVGALSLLNLGNRPLWYDEYTTWYAASISTGDLFHLLRNEDAVLAPYYLFMRGWTHFAGVSAVSLRLPSALAMMAAAALVVIVGERLLGARAGLTAGLLFAVIPNITRYAQEARPYGFAMAATLLATLLLLRALEQPSWSRWAGYGAALAVTGLAHLVAVLIVLPHLVAVLWPPRNWRRIWPFLVAAGIGGAIVLPLVILGSGESAAISWLHFTVSSVRTYPYALAGSQTVAVAVATLALAGAVIRFGTHRPSVLLLLVWAVGPFLVTLVTAPLLDLFLFRYLLFTIPAWCLLAAAAVSAVEGRWLTLGAPAVLLVWIGYLALPGLSQAWLPPGEPDFRAAAGVVVAHEQAGDSIIYGHSDRDSRLDMAYELRLSSPPRDVLLTVPPQALGGYAAHECAHPEECLSSTSRLWLIAVYPTAEHPYGQLSPSVERLLHNDFTVQQHFPETDVTVYLLDRAR
jgi:mannosyltransferase